MSDSAGFWDKIAPRYSRQPVADEASYRRKLRITREYFRPDMEVLEFGCGTGSTAIVHAPYVKHILAIDISPRMLEIARDKADAAAVANITFERNTIEAFTRPGETFDAVLGLSILHLLENKEQAIAKVRDMLKPGGLFVTSTVCLGDWMPFFGLIGPIGRRLGLMPLVRVFTAEALEAALIEAGFRIDYRWRPAKNKALFIVAVKAGR